MMYPLKKTERVHAIEIKLNRNLRLRRAMRGEALLSFLPLGIGFY